MDVSSDAGDAVTDTLDNASDVDTSAGDNGGDVTGTVENSGNLPSSALDGLPSNRITNGKSEEVLCKIPWAFVDGLLLETGSIVEAVGSTGV
ncbi:rab escort protein [Moniliophthora roreri]|nr:rab escort protein [Moniliophthora roreri]